MSKLKKELEKVLEENNVEGRVEKVIYDTQDDFFEKRRIWDEIKNDMEEFPRINKLKMLDKKIGLKNINENISGSDLDNLLEIKEIEGLIKEEKLKEESFDILYYDKFLSELPDFLVNDIIKIVVKEIKYMNFFEIQDSDILEELYDIEYPMEFFDIMENLSYCTCYYQPRIWDEDIAFEVGLLPFKWKGENYLALNGGGMDLSPKLIAYQALTSSTISKRFLHRIKDEDYIKYVVGEEIAKKVFEEITLDIPNYKVLTY